jgi:glycosyltransferase involved in cell wall biosynthesis
MKHTPVTIAYVAWAPFFSGAERALLVMVESLDVSKFRPVAIVGTDAELAAELRTRGVYTIHIPIVYSGRRQLPSWMISVGRFVRTLRRQRAALVHSNDLPSFQPAAYAARILGIPALTHVRFPDARTGFEWFLKPGFNRALFVSESLRTDALKEAPDLFNERTEVVYDGVIVPPLVDKPTTRQLREELGLPEDRIVVVLAGQVAEVKGIWDYIDAAEILAARGLPVVFAVLGDDLRTKGAVRRDAERVVQERGLSEVVRFLGFRPNAQRLIPAFDIVAVPSHVEPLGNATLEAMASARPVIGSRVGGIPEMVVDGVTGLLVPSKDPSRLAAAIERLSGDAVQRRALGLAGRQRALDRFGVAAHGAHIQAIYEHVLGRFVNPAMAPTS